MKIAFACPACGRGFEVDAANVGRRARCKGCGGTVTVPATSAPAPGPDLGTYALDDPPPEAAPVPAGPSTYVRARANPEGLAPGRRRPEPDAVIGRAREGATAIAARVSALWPWLVGVPAGVAVVLGLVAAIVPGGTMIAGGALAVVGILLLLGGHAMGAYVAFTEDALHGWLYLLVPIYTAYYLVENWDEMWRWCLLSVAGVAILSVAGPIMHAGLEKAEPAEVAPEDDARVVRPVGPDRLVRAIPVALIRDA